MSYCLCKNTIEHVFTEFEIHQVFFLKVIGHRMVNLRRYSGVPERTVLGIHLSTYTCSLRKQQIHVCFKGLCVCVYMHMHTQTYHIYILAYSMYRLVTVYVCYIFTHICTPFILKNLVPSSAVQQISV